MSPAAPRGTEAGGAGTELTHLVEELRAEELASIGSEVAAGRREHILKTLDERGRAQELVRQQYTGRYPFELLQNANDAAGDRALDGSTVRFVLTDDALLVADMGAGFGPNQIRAICGLGRSSKDPRKSIGYKGLGFKSVGEITDEPQIFSVEVGFHFDAARVRREVAALAGELDPRQRLPVYAFPFATTLADAGSDADAIGGLLDGGFRTVLRLPLRAGVARAAISAHLETTLSPRLLLFLDATEQLELVGTDEDFVAVAVRQDQDGHLETLLEARGQTEHWLVFERQLDIPEPELVAPLGDAWREVERVRVAAAVPLDDDGLPTRLEPQPIHVYFPTQEASGFGLLLQADFSLELDRRRIATTPEAATYNAWLVEQLGMLIGGDVARGLAARYPEQAGVVSALAVTDQPSGIGTDIVEATVRNFSGSAFVPTLAGDARPPGETLLLPGSVHDPRHAHRHLATADLGPLVLPGVEQDRPARQLLADRLGSPELSAPDLLARLTEPGPAEVADYYEFLVAWSDRAGLRALAPALREVPCVRTLAGYWRAPSEGLFFPRQRDEVVFPEELPVPIADVPEVDGLRALLEEAGVSPFEWRQLLPEFILPLLTDDAIDAPTRRLALEALRQYYRTERTGDPRLRVQTARVLLPARRADGSSRTLQPAGAIYFTSTWTGRDRLKTIYGPFGRHEFLALDPPDDPEQRREELAFFQWIGVAEHARPDPRIVDQRDIHLTHALHRHPHATAYREHWEHWLARQEVQHARRCPQGHQSSQQLRASFGLDRFPQVIADASPERLTALWTELATNWATHYKDGQTAVFYCQHTGHGGERTRPAPSLMAHLLEQLAWVPASRRDTLDLATPGEAWRLARDTPRRVRDRVPVLPRTLDQPWASALCADLGLVDAARPAARQLVDLLGLLAEEWQETSGDQPDVRGVTDAARWAMRTLNDVLNETSESLTPGAVPLLARRDGRYVFDPKPYVADDGLLAETWEPTLPILDADRDLRQLHAALELPSLDALTEKTPVPVGARPDARDAIRAELKAAGPFLGVVAAEAVPSRAAEVYRGLARLEIEVCDNLIVRYELDGEIRERAEAVAFIAVRQEQQGSVRRNIGTAHLEVDPATGRPHWYVFGPMLARFLNVPGQGDAFSLLLAGSTTSRPRVPPVPADHQRGPRGSSNSAQAATRRRRLRRSRRRPHRPAGGRTTAGLERRCRRTTSGRRRDGRHAARRR
jgi:hypothetical protein